MLALTERSIEGQEVGRPKGKDLGNPASRESYFSVSVLLTNASFLLSGDHDGTLIVPCPP